MSPPTKTEMPAVGSKWRWSDPEQRRLMSATYEVIEPTGKWARGGLVETTITGDREHGDGATILLRDSDFQNGRLEKVSG